MGEPEHGRSSSRPADGGKAETGKAGVEPGGWLLRLAQTRPAVRLRYLHGLLTNAKTMGVRVAAFDADGRLFLVRHTYVAGWHLAGGGVDRGETVAEAARREIAEEGNLVPRAPLVLASVHFNRRQLARDHVFLFRCARVDQSAQRLPDREIAETGFFALDALPAGTSPATRRRLAELAGEVPLDPDW